MDVTTIPTWVEPGTGHMCICARSRQSRVRVMCMWVTNVSLVIGDLIIKTVAVELC